MQVVRENKFVIADPKTCIGCATCMAACYQSAYERGKLATPRLIVTRTEHGVMPNQCRQCDDAPCANVCPVGALTFGEDSIELHEEICIGCKLCTIACPFGAIRAASEFMPSVDYRLEPEPALTLESVIGLKTIAVKCDLCKGREGGPACVEACPTGALKIMDPKNQEKMISQKAQKAVEKTVQTGIAN
ncbi:4Fe-4S dicluster domain-containing protein [Nautilia sp.]